MYNMSHLSDFHIALDHGQNPGVSQRTLEDRKEEQGGGGGGGEVPSFNETRLAGRGIGLTEIRRQESRGYFVAHQIRPWK